MGGLRRNRNVKVSVRDKRLKREMVGEIGYKYSNDSMKCFCNVLWALAGNTDFYPGEKKVLYSVIRKCTPKISFTDFMQIWSKI